MKKATKAKIKKIKKKKITKPILLDKETLEIYTPIAKKIAELKNQAMQDAKAKGKPVFDLLSTDNLKKILSHSLINQYDPTYQANFRRNGIDAISGDDQIEEKNNTVDKARQPRKSGRNKGQVPQAAWQFHANHDDTYNRLNLKVWDKESLLVRVYDIKRTDNLEMIKKFINKLAEAYLKKVRLLGKKATKRDNDAIPEKLITECKSLSTINIDGITVIKDW